MLDIQKYIGTPKIIVEDLSNGTSRYEIQYLPRGFGYTLGNAMRRIMLGYDFGAAITGLKVHGYTHEYQVVDGMKETIVDFMLNLKKVRFRVDEDSDSLQWVSQTFSGVGIYNAKDLKLPGSISLLSDDDYLFEITDPNLELCFDIRIEKGYGYFSMDFLKDREKQSDIEEVGLILIDNDFRSVEYVTYEVEEVIDDFIGGMKDKLIIDVKMKFGSISSKDFMSFAGEVLASYAKLFIFEDAYIDRSVLVEYEALGKNNDKLPEEENIMTMPIDALPLSERTRNALIKNNVLYVEDLEQKKKGELLIMKGVGRKAIEEINSALGNIGKALAG